MMATSDDEFQFEFDDFDTQPTSKVSTDDNCSTLTIPSSAAVKQVITGEAHSDDDDFQFNDGQDKRPSTESVCESSDSKSTESSTSDSDNESGDIKSGSAPTQKSLPMKLIAPKSEFACSAPLSPHTTGSFFSSFLAARKQEIPASPNRPLPSTSTASPSQSPVRPGKWS